MMTMTTVTQLSISLFGGLFAMAFNGIRHSKRSMDEKLYNKPSSQHFIILLNYAVSTCPLLNNYV